VISRQVRSMTADALAIAAGQVVALIYPLVSLPLLARALGAAALGRLIFLFAIVQLLVKITDYGFAVSAVRRIAVSDDDNEASAVIGATLAAMVFLWSIGSAILLAIALAVPTLRAEFWLYALGVVLVGAGISFPEWLLKGLRKLKAYAVVIGLSRMLCLAGLYVTVHGRGDVAWALLWQFAHLTIAGLVVWPAIMRRLPAVPLPRVRDVRRALTDGWHLFVSSIAQAAMASVPSVIVGAVSAAPQVAFYGSAERFGNAGRGILFTVCDAMIPRMTDVRHRGDAESKRTRRIIMSGLFSLFALGGCGLIVVAGRMVPWYLGPGFAAAIPVTQVMGICLIVIGGVGVFALALNADHRYKTTAGAMLIGAVFHLVLVVPAAVWFGALGAAWALVCGETIVLVQLVIAHLRFTRPRIGGTRNDLAPSHREPHTVDGQSTTSSLSSLRPDTPSLG